jgi:hypothetical protein
MPRRKDRGNVLHEGNMLRLAWANLWLSLFGMPLTLWLTREPPFILALSWYAVTVTALGHISAARANQEIVDIKADSAQVEAERATVSAPQLAVRHTGSRSAPTRAEKKVEDSA